MDIGGTDSGFIVMNLYHYINNKIVLSLNRLTLIICDISLCFVLLRKIL